MDLTEVVASGMHLVLDAEDERRCADLHREFLARFPRERWSTMTKEEYSLGTENSRESYCYAVEFGTGDLGSIAGGSAKKHRIFYRKAAQEWYFPSEFDTADEAWEALRSAFLTLFELADRGDWAETSGVDQLRTVNMIRMKALYLYFSDQLLPCYSKRHLQHFAAELGVDPTGDIIVLNRRLLKRLRAEPGLESASGVGLMRMLYSLARPPSQIADSYVKITAPGDDAEWDRWQREETSTLNWGDVGDLSQFDSQQELALALKQGSAGRTGTGRAKEIWRTRKLTPGTHLVAARGTGDVIGLGVVQEPGYTFDPDGGDVAHSVTVDWSPPFRKTLNKPIPGWALHDLVNLNGHQIKDLLEGSDVPDAELERSDAVIDLRFYEWERLLEKKKQVIFYGPPGTGKTYHAKQFLRWFLDRRGAPASNEVSKQLVEITFHSSYSYEEFVEGYRPAPTTTGGGLSLELRPGLFKRLAETASARPDEAFVLLIDEINRANVPQVFGELLTVLEADKRKQTVQLPASGEDFAVPENLYVVGTMNTADRSIRTLDTALRRRFGFVELMPDSSVLIDSEITELDLVKFLDDLNDKVARRAGRERQIGHSHFMIEGAPLNDAQQFVDAMRFDIVPLLQDLVYDDYGQLAEYLGTEIVDVPGRALQDLDDSEFIARLDDHYRSGGGEE